MTWRSTLPVLTDPLLTYASTVKRPARAPWLLYGLRFGCVVLGLAAWFITQGLIGARTYNGQIDDAVLYLLTPVHDYLMTHAAARNGLLISSSLGIDALAVFMLLTSIFGPTIRPFLGLLILFSLRQAFQAICVLPRPEEMIWQYPGFPSLLVTYGVSNDLFFSGHTALAVFGAVELGRRWRGLIPLGIALVVFEVVTVLALRAHWTMDVYAGAVTALLIAGIAGKIAPPVDRLLARITKTRPAL